MKTWILLLGFAFVRPASAAAVHCDVEYVRDGSLQSAIINPEIGTVTVVAKTGKSTELVTPTEILNAWGELVPRSNCIDSKTSDANYPSEYLGYFHDFACTSPSFRVELVYEKFAPDSGNAYYRLWENNEPVYLIELKNCI